MTTLEKVLEEILNMPILDEKDVEKIRNKENRSVTMHEESQRMDNEQYSEAPVARTVAFNDETYNVGNMTQQEQNQYKQSYAHLFKEKVEQAVKEDLKQLKTKSSFYDNQNKYKNVAMDSDMKQPFI